jgi:hypothetical protein
MVYGDRRRSTNPGAAACFVAVSAGSSELADIDLLKARFVSFMQVWELLSYMVTVVGLPMALGIFIYEQRKERDNEDEEVYQLLADAYNDFLKLVLANPDLKLRSQAATPDLTEEQQERMHVIFEMLISLFERAYLTAFDDHMTAKQQRRWHSWDDFMREWVRRDDFRMLLPRLLQGEDRDFAIYIRRLAKEEGQSVVGQVSNLPVL